MSTPDSIADTIEALEHAAELLDTAYVTADNERAGYLEAIAVLHAAEDLLRVARIDTVDAARAAGVTWSAMADRLGVRPQAVQKRYG